MTSAPSGGPGLTPFELNLLDSEYGNMLSCVRCGQCLTSCPTYVLSGREAEGPRGRVALARAVHDGVLPLTPELLQHEANCLICDACTAVCPAGVHMDPLQVAFRSAVEAHVQRGGRERLIRRVVFRTLFTNMRLFRLLVLGLWLYQVTGLQKLARALGLVWLFGMQQAEAFLPRVSRPFLVPKGEVYRATDTAGGEGAMSRAPTALVAEGARFIAPSNLPASAATPVSFFAGCVMSTAMADVDRATIRVLQRAGCDVTNTAGQGCCGALNAHSGDLDTAKLLARQNIEAFERDGDAAIVINSAGCGAMLKDYGHHFRDDPAWAERAKAFSKRVRDVTEFLAGRALPMRRALSASVTYQEPCHLAHAQRISQQPRSLLRAIPGLELREMPESSLCCGSAGVYNLTNPKESRQLQQRKLDNAATTRATVIVTANPGCLIQLQSGLDERGEPTQVKHIVELLDEATAP
jgi:glycolate oxidase iron-sulfur subunit